MARELVRDRMVIEKEGSARRADRMVDPTEPVAPAMRTFLIEDVVDMVDFGVEECVACSCLCCAVWNCSVFVEKC